MTSPRVHSPEQVARSFQDHFGERGKLFRAPGRVNLIGEHTDYNEGFVLPAAIDLSCWVAASPRAGRILKIHSENFEQQEEVSLEDDSSWPRNNWAAYPLGVAWALAQAGHRLTGCNLYIAGDVPLGSGLSSSAAVEVATALALLNLAGAKLERTKIALLCQRAENEFVGARCGIMDQFIACRGKSRRALLLDCRTLDAQAIPLPEGVSLVVCNTMVKHALAANEYNQRRAECQEGLRLLRTVLPGALALRDVSLDELEQHQSLLPPVIYRRCRHVISENARTQKTAAALLRGSVTELSGWMAESHRSLRDDFEVSCRELDAMVEIASVQDGVLGARMSGGGFGGATINVVRSEAVAAFTAAVEREYHRRTEIHPEILAVHAAEGAGEVS